MATPPSNETLPLFSQDILRQVSARLAQQPVAVLRMLPSPPLEDQEAPAPVPAVERQDDSRWVVRAPALRVTLSALGSSTGWVRVRYDHGAGSTVSS